MWPCRGNIADVVKRDSLGSSMSFTDFSQPLNRNQSVNGKLQNGLNRDLDSTNPTRMTVKDLQILFNYSYWANRQLFSALRQLSTAQFTQSTAGSYGSVRNTIVHMLSAEWGWLDRCGGTARGAALIASDYPTLSSVVERWQQVEGYVREFLSILRDEDLDRNVEFALGTGPKQTMLLGELMHHAANHGAHHRGQLAMLIRMLGYAPGNFDILLYYARNYQLDRTGV
jgi:uncharacterized damage-inducible protein DinB